MSISKRPTEKELYEQIWQHDEYRVDSPGERLIDEFFEMVRPEKGSTILDIGCGSGRASTALAQRGLRVAMLDFAGNCLNKDIAESISAGTSNLRFIEHDITKPFPISADYGYCTDVLEHIHPSQVDAVIDNCLHACKHVFFQVASFNEVHGPELIGHQLHLTIEPFNWWLKKFTDRDCYIHASSNLAIHYCFFVTSSVFGLTTTAKEIMALKKADMRDNVKYNIQKGWKQLTQKSDNDIEVAIVGGGPSLSSQLDELQRIHKEGAKIVTINGSYKWCLDNGIPPDYFITADMKPSTAQFLHPVLNNCQFLIASQCYPKVLDFLPQEFTFLWHVNTDAIKDILNKHYDEQWWGIAQSSAMGVLAIPLLHTQGIRNFHLFGLDSCLDGEKHHAYPQPDSEEEHKLPVLIGERAYRCYLWMAKQAQDFLGLVKSLDDDVNISVYGEGLLSYMLQLGDEMAAKEEGKINETMP